MRRQQESLCYISPDGRRFDSKKEIEEAMERELAMDEARTTMGQMQCLFSPPTWPDGNWLPHNWKVAYTLIRWNPHLIYIPPGQSAGFLFHRMCVERYLADRSSVELIPFYPSAPPLKKVKRESHDPNRFVTFLNKVKKEKKSE